MKFSQIKEIKDAVNGSEDWKTIIKEIERGESDIYTDEYRVIEKSVIDSLVADEIQDQLYAFRPEFLADITQMSETALRDIQTCRHAEATLNEFLNPYLEEIAEEYVSTEGYGHIFASYDGQEIETEDHYVFRI
jgi:hypothetical protein